MLRLHKTNNINSVTVIFSVIGLMLILADQALAQAIPTASASLCNPSQLHILEGVQNAILGPSRQLFTNAEVAAVILWKSLATLEVAWFLIGTLALKRSFEEILSQFSHKIFAVLFILGMLVSIGQSGGKIVTDIVINSFAGLGSAVATQVNSGVTQVGGSYYNADVSLNSGPNGNGSRKDVVSDVLNTGVCAGINVAQAPSLIFSQQIANQANQPTINNSGTGGGFDITKLPAQIGSALTSGITASLGTLLTFLTTAIMFAFSLPIGIFVAYVFARLAAELVFVLFEASLVLAAGVVLVGFAASRWTNNLASGWFRYATAVGFKIFTIELVIGLGTGLITGTISGAITALANSGTSANPVSAGSLVSNVLAGPTLDVSVLVQITVVAVIIDILAKNVNSIASQLTGSPNMSMGHQALSSAVSLPAQAAATAATAAVVISGGVALSRLATAAGGAVAAGGGGVGQTAEASKANSTVKSTPPAPSSDATNNESNFGRQAPAAPTVVSGLSQPPSTESNPPPSSDTYSQQSVGDSTPTQASGGSTIRSAAMEKAQQALQMGGKSNGENPGTTNSGAQRQEQQAPEANPLHGISG